MKRILLQGVAVTLLTASMGWAEELPVDLTELSLEELMEVEITSVSKKEERLFEAAAAVSVVTAEDIRRSDATSLPEALRMVPGMEVARIDASKWGVSCRGFNDLFANKLLVLIDGRSVYTPLFSGVFWESQDVVLEDVERIEVIRGPGATLWGANAVNGIINIITKGAQDTQGGCVVAGAGSEEQGFGSIRYGGSLDSGDVYYRIYVKYLNRDDSAGASDMPAADGWWMMRAGFRMDWEGLDGDLLMVQGDLYDGEVGQMYRLIRSLEPPYERTFTYMADMSGGDVLGRWGHVFPDGSDLVLQVYYDRAEREEAVIVCDVNTVDLDVQHRFRMGTRQEIVWGAGYRFMWDNSTGIFPGGLTPESRHYDLMSAFLQDEVAFAGNRLRLTLGSKFEHNDYTGFEVQPNIRLSWMPREHHIVWGAVARAVRTPSRGEHDMRYTHTVLPPGAVLPDTPPTLLTLMGNRAYRSEELLSFELGYRVRPMDRLVLDLATFYGVYDKLHTYEPGLPFGERVPLPEHLVVPISGENKMYGETYGVELEATMRMSEGWRMRLAYGYLDVRMHLREDSSYTTGEEWEGVSPHHQFSVRSSMDLPEGLTVDLGGRYVGDLPDVGVKSYASLDVRLGWTVWDNLELSVVGQNVLDDRHTEFRTPYAPTLSTEVERGVYGAIHWTF